MLLVFIFGDVFGAVRRPHLRALGRVRLHECRETPWQK